MQGYARISATKAYPPHASLSQMDRLQVPEWAELLPQHGPLQYQQFATFQA